MQWGGDIDFLASVSQEKGELTKSLQAMPQLEEGDHIVWELFVILSASRTHRMKFGKDGAQYIVPEAVQVDQALVLIRATGCDCTEQLFRILRLIQRLDGVYLDQHIKKAK